MARAGIEFQKRSFNRLARKPEAYYQLGPSEMRESPMLRGAVVSFRKGGTEIRSTTRRKCGCRNYMASLATREVLGWMRRDG